MGRKSALRSVPVRSAPVRCLYAHSNTFDASSSGWERRERADGGVEVQLKGMMVAVESCNSVLLNADILDDHLQERSSRKLK